MSTEATQGTGGSIASPDDMEILRLALRLTGEALISLNYANRISSAGVRIAGLAELIGRRSSPTVGTAPAPLTDLVAGKFVADETQSLILAELRKQTALLERPYRGAPAAQAGAPSKPKIPAISVALGALIEGVKLARDDNLNQLMHSLAVKFTTKDIEEWWVATGCGPGVVSSAIPANP